MKCAYVVDLDRFTDCTRRYIHVGRTIEMTDNVLSMISRKGFVWCLLHASDIDRAIENAGAAIIDSYNRFNVG